MTSRWKEGDRVLWQHPLVNGKPVPGVVRKVTPKRVTIEVVFSLRGETIRGMRSVVPLNLSPRAQHLPELDE